ncbi:MAG: electron transfer flavoprotein subunit alpha/FixB family protein [Chloroflexota bacterium]
MVASLYDIQEENKTIWVFLEHEDGSLKAVSLELLSKGRDLADSANMRLKGLLLGHEVAHLTAEAISYGADEVMLFEHPLLANFTAEAYTEAAFAALLEDKPSIFLLGATPNGRDLAGRLAVRLRTGLNADCTDLRLEEKTGILVCEVSGFGGGVLALIAIRTHRPQMATVRPGVFEPKEKDLERKGVVHRLKIGLSADRMRTTILERRVGGTLDLTGTPFLVAGGRGIEGKFNMLRELADLLGGDVGATRPPVDEGHIERERQIGQTGVICRPKVAICCGISGAFHFVVGIEKADTVIAINSDPEAPIFDYADYCIIDDVHQVVPALIHELSKVTTSGRISTHS